MLQITGRRKAIWGEPVEKGVTCRQTFNHDLDVTMVSGRSDCDTTWLGTTETLDDLLI